VIRGKKKMLVIGLTGGIASGKSTVLSIFENLGVKTLDSDIIARDVVKKGKPALKEIVKKFGKEFLKKDGALNRKKMGDLIFQYKQKRKDLEKIIHPKVIEIYKKTIKSLKSGILVIDIPLLFEAGLQRQVNKIVTVWVPRNVQIKRLTQRGKLSRKEALLRINSQWSLERKRNLSDFIVDNSGSLEETKKIVTYLYALLCSQN
jgi:dephospho-CoA kinase